VFNAGFISVKKEGSEEIIYTGISGNVSKRRGIVILTVPRQPKIFLQSGRFAKKEGLILVERLKLFTVFLHDVGSFDFHGLRDHAVFER